MTKRALALDEAIIIFIMRSAECADVSVLSDYKQNDVMSHVCVCVLCY